MPRISLTVAYLKPFILKEVPVLILKQSPVNPLSYANYDARLAVALQVDKKAPWHDLAITSK